jgi:hypothetical protein
MGTEEYGICYPFPIPWRRGSTPCRPPRTPSPVGVPTRSSRCPTDPRFLRPPTPGRTASTPARHLRLLIPINLVLRFPDCVTTTPEAFAIPNDRPVTDVIARQSALAMAYNPNHCIEIRWGAPNGSP